MTPTLHVLTTVSDQGLNIQSAVAAPRIHHQWLPDELRVEEGLSPDTISILEDMGHRIVRKSSMGAIQSIMVRDKMMYGAADPRRSTALAVGF